MIEPQAIVVKDGPRQHRCVCHDDGVPGARRVEGAVAGHRDQGAASVVPAALISCYSLPCLACRSAATLSLILHSEGVQHLQSINVVVKDEIVVTVVVAALQ